MIYFAPLILIKISMKMQTESIKETVEETVDEMMSMDESDSLFSDEASIEYATKVFRDKLINYYN